MTSWNHSTKRWQPQFNAMSRPKGVVAAGHPETARTAGIILKEGGNAFDALIAAQFTAFVAEPVLTSPGGGGFLLAETPGGKQVAYDFFVQTPSIKRDKSGLQFFPISANFGEVKQDFHIGPGAAAVPGMVKGIFEIHRDLCTIPISRLAEPAIALAREGVAMNAFQSGVFDIIKPIYQYSEEVRQIFRSPSNPSRLIREGEILKLPDLADTLEALVKNGEDFFYDGDIARSISKIFSDEGGHLTRDDLRNYRIIKREPLKFTYRDGAVSINPPPASGGILVAFALKLLERVKADVPPFGSETYPDLLSQVQHMTNKARVDALAADQPAVKLLDPAYLERYRKEIAGRTAFYRGTTQISIEDSSGNLASLTSSNGEGCGVLIPGTGIMLNNMLGEQDLNPGGFHSWRPNQRLTSMMAPGILKMKGNTNIVFGSGGSNRIRTAILQVLINLVDFKMPLEEAVNSPRIHFEDGKLNAETGFAAEQITRLKKRCPEVKIWKEKSLFFGGVHCVSRGPRGFKGSGDVRRGGISLVID
jgi:gamma-glutamyltranspeptidase / glutathione hydrolase